MVLDRGKGAQSLYAQITAYIKEQIESGKYQNGSFLPTEKQLESTFNVSRVTVRQAISELVNEGYVETAQGIGTLVVFDKINEKFNSVISFSQEMAQHGMTMETSHCTIRKIKADEFLAVQLNTRLNREIYELVRVRCVKGRPPLVYSITYLNSDNELPLLPIKYMDSLYSLLKNEHGIEIVRGEETLEAMLADKEISRMLAVPIKAPVFKRVRRTFDQHDKALEYTICFYDGSKYKYSITL